MAKQTIVDAYLVDNLEELSNILEFFTKRELSTMLPEGAGIWEVIIFEETLSDGSKVRNVRISGEGYSAS